MCMQLINSCYHIFGVLHAGLILSLKTFKIVENVTQVHNEERERQGGAKYMDMLFKFCYVTQTAGKHSTFLFFLQILNKNKSNNEKGTKQKTLV